MKTIGELTLEELLRQLFLLFNESDAIEIESGIPIPAVLNRQGGTIYPWEALEIGQSFRAPHTRVSVTNANKRYFPKKFTGKTLQQHGVKYLRVWRVQ